MKFSATLLLVTCISSVITAPLPDTNDDTEFGLDRRLPGAKQSPAPKLPAAKPTVKKPSTTKPPAKKPATTKPPAKKPGKSSPGHSTKKKAAATKAATKASTKAKPTKVATSAARKATKKPSASTAKKPAPRATKANKCALPKSTVTGPKRSILLDVENVVRVDAQEFIGWHGTNSKTADLWTRTGSVVKPTNDDGSVAGKSGLDAELGPGLYLTDTLSVAEAASQINAKNNPGLSAKACAIFAKSSTEWRQNIIKAQIPETIRGNGAQFEKMRVEYLANLGRKSPTPGPRIGPLTSSHNQMLIPENVNPKLAARCFDVVGLQAQNVDHSIPTINYRSDTLKAQWEIVREDQDLAKAVKAAIQANCK